jgi:hypothetical protein
MFRLGQSFVEVSCYTPRFFRFILGSLEELPELNSVLWARLTIHERVSYFITIMVGYMGVYVMLLENSLLSCYACFQEKLD